MRVVSMLLMLLGLPVSAAQGFCALSVRVVDPEGEVQAGAEVKLLDSRGKVVYSAVVGEPELKICDFGFGEHSLEIGSESCGKLTIHHIWLIPGRTIHLRAVLNRCGPGDLVYTGCPAYFRLVSESGVQLRGVRVESTRRKLETDEYGRLFFLVQFGDREVVTFLSPDYTPTTRVLTCEKGSGFREEIMLRSSADK